MPNVFGFLIKSTIKVRFLSNETIIGQVVNLPLIANPCEKVEYFSYTESTINAS